MNFQIIYKQVEAKIVVIGEFEETKHEAELIELLNLLEKKNINITFLQANIIPRIIVEKLFNLQDFGKCTVFVLQRYLYSYLQNLGINCKYANENWSLNKLTENSSDKIQILNKEEV